jgi:hypothetical protein
MCCRGRFAAAATYVWIARLVATAVQPIHRLDLRISDIGSVVMVIAAESLRIMTTATFSND